MTPLPPSQMKSSCTLVLLLVITTTSGVLETQSLACTGGCNTIIGKFYVGLPFTFTLLIIILTFLDGGFITLSIFTGAECD